MSASVSQEDSVVFLDLPRPWLANLFQHVASGPGGLASAAALSQTCSSLHALSESSAVSYRNIHVPQDIRSSRDPVWRWLAKRQGRVHGLQMEVGVDVHPLHGPGAADPKPEWMQHLQTLSVIPDLHLTVYCIGVLCGRESPFMEEWLKPHRHLIDGLTAKIDVEGKYLSMTDFCAAAAACRSIDLTISHHSEETLNLRDLAPVMGSLVCIDIQGNDYQWPGKMEHFDMLTSIPKLTGLSLSHLDFTAADSWATLASLTGLEDLKMNVTALGDPSLLSELTRLSRLEVCSCDSGEDVDAVPFSFSSLQPLSALLQLETLLLSDSCAATSLQGLAGLCKLRQLSLLYTPNLVSLEGISGSITKLFILHAEGFQNLSGIGVLAGLKQLVLSDCNTTSLQPLAGLCCLERLELVRCPVSGLGGLEGTLSTSLQSLKLSFCESLRELSGLEKLCALQQLYVSVCGVTSLQPVAELTGGLVQVSIGECKYVKEEVLELPHIQPTADVRVRLSNVKEVVLAGGVRRVVEHA